MMTRDWNRLFISGCMLLWLGLIIAPALAQADELVEIQHPSIDFLYAAEGAPVSSRNIYLEPVSVWYPTGSERGVSSADQLRLLAYGYLERAFGAQGFTPVASESGESLIARIQYIDLSASPASAATLAWARQFRFRVEPGYITIVAEVRDATGRVLLRMADLKEDESAPGDVAAPVEAALQYWSEVIAASIAWPAEAAQVARVASH